MMDIVIGLLFGLIASLPACFLILIKAAYSAAYSDESPREPKIYVIDLNEKRLRR